MHKFAMITFFFLLGMNFSFVWAEDEPEIIEPVMVVTVDNPISVSDFPQIFPKTQWCPDEDCILLIENQMIFHFLDIATGQDVTVDISASKPQDSTLQNVYIKPDASEFLIIWPEVSIDLWNIRGERLLSVETADRVPFAMWSGDGSLLSVDQQDSSGDNQVLIFDALTHTQIQSFEGDYNVWFGDRNEIITWSLDGSFVFLWNARTGEQLNEFITSGEVEYAWPDDTQSQIFAYTQQGTFYIWNLADRNLDRTFNYGAEIYFPIVDNDAGKVVINGYSNGDVKVWDIATGSLSFTVEQPDDNAPTAINVSPPGDLLTVKSADSVLLVDINTGETLHEFGFSGFAISRWSPEGNRLLIASSDNFVCSDDCETRVDVREVETGEQLLNITYSALLYRENAKWIWDSDHIITFAENTMSIWDVSKGIELYRMNHGDSIEYIDDMFISPSQKRIFTVGGNALFVWDLSGLSSSSQ